MNSDEIAVRVSADGTAVAPGMRQASDAVKSGVETMKGHFETLSNPFESLFKAFGALSALLAGGAVFKEAINATKEFTGESVALSKQLGITTNEAAALNIALGDIGSDASSYGAAASMLTRQLKTNEKALNAMGMETRNSKGELLGMKQQMENAVETLRGYKEGTDRNLAAQTLFGRGAQDAAKLLKLTSEVTEEAKKKQEELGLTVGTENVAALKKNKAAMNDVADVFLAVKKVIGDVLMPALTTLANWFAATGPYLVIAFRVAMAALAAVVYVVAGAIEMLYKVARDFASGIIESFANMGEVMQRLMKGDFAGAWEVGTRAIKTTWANTMNDVVDTAKKTYANVMGIFDKPTIGASKAPEGKDYINPKEAKPKAEKADKSMLPQWEAELAQAKVTYQMQNNLREMSKTEEIKYWQDILASQLATADERIAIEKRIAMAQLEAMKKAAIEKKAMTELQIAEAQAGATDLVNIETARADEDYALGKIDEARRLQLEKDYLNDLFQIDSAAQQTRIAAMAADPNHSASALQREKDQLLAVERKYALDLAKNDTRIRVEAQTTFRAMAANVGSAFTTMFSSIITGQSRVGAAFKQMGLSIVQSTAQWVGQYLSKKAAGWVAESALYKAFLGEKTGSEAAAASTTVATKAVESDAVVVANAAEGASGAFAALASIPYVGPVLGAAAFAAAMALIMGVKGGGKSAAGGMDVARGDNPMVQIHSEEMVLPAKHANAIREMTEGGGGGGRSNAPMVFNINAMDGKDVHRVLMNAGDSIVKSLNMQRRNFNGALA